MRACRSGPVHERRRESDDRVVMIGFLETMLRTPKLLQREMMKS